MATLCTMEECEELDLDVKQVIVKSESDEWSEYNDSKEADDDDGDVQYNETKDSEHMNENGKLMKTNIVKIECDVDVSEYNMEIINNNSVIDITHCKRNLRGEKVFYHAHGKGKRKFVSMETKLEAIRKLDQGEKVRKVASELGVGEVTVGDWRRNRARIEKWCMEKCSEDASSSRKTMKRSDFEKTSEALFLWFSQERLKGIPISGPMLQEKALYFHKQLQDGDGSFTASVGWLDRWKKRYGVSRLTMCGEKLSFDLEAVETFQNKLHSLMKNENLSADQLYNCDETGLKYKTLPYLPRQETELFDYQKSKERVTILACCNATGQHRLPLMLIGKTCFLEPLKSVSSKELPVTFKINKNSLIDREIFKEWFMNEFVPRTEAFLKEKNLPRKAVLILNSASSHPSEEELISDGIRTLFLPPTYTSLLQPLNPGVFMCFKINYRINLLKMLLKIKKESGIINYFKNITLKDVVDHMAESWFKLPSQTLIRAWKKLLTDSQVLHEIDHSEGKALLIRLILEIPGYKFADESTLQQWFEQDDYYEVFGTSTSEYTNEESSGESDTSKGGGQNGVIQNKAFHAKGLAALDLVLRYIKQQKEATPADILFIERWRHYAENNLSKFQK